MSTTRATSVKRPKVLVLAIHPAPYVDDTFTEVVRRGNVELHVCYLFSSNISQPYLSEHRAVVFSHEALNRCRFQYPPVQEKCCVSLTLSICSSQLSVGQLGNYRNDGCKGEMKSIARAILKSNLYTYGLFARLQARRFESRVSAEEVDNASRNGAGGLVYSEELVKQLLAERLRGKAVRAKPKGALHIFAGVRDYSWENDGLIAGLRGFGQVTHFDWNEIGYDDSDPAWFPDLRASMNRALLEELKGVHTRERTDVFFAYVGHRTLAPDIVQGINRLGIVTVNFTMDDMQAFHGTASSGVLMGLSPLVSRFDLNLTATFATCPFYLMQGGIPFFTPPAANPDIYKAYGAARDLDVSFVGAHYGYRPILIHKLRKNGIPVHTFGPGWPSGPLKSTEDMVRIWNRSKSCLGHGGVQYSTKVS